jgi:subtilisin family serine protease
MTTPAIQEQLQTTGLAQVIVVLRTPGLPPQAGAAAAPGAPARPSVRRLAAGLEAHFVTSEAGQDAALIRAAVRRKTLPGGAEGLRLRAMEAVSAQPGPPPRMRVFENLGIVLGTVDRQGLRALQAEASVYSVTAAPPISLIRPVAARPSRLSRGCTWGLQRLGVPQLRRQGLTGKGVLVGHLDTGVDGGHPALRGAVRSFADFDFLGEPVPGATPHDTDTHGTHTAGTIAGRAVGRAEFGAAPGAELCSALVIEGGNVVARVLAGLDWVVGQQARILSLSLGLRGYREDFLPVIQVLRARNVLPIIAVGNEGPGTSRSPGNYPAALSVGAVGEDGRVAPFSSGQRFRRAEVPLVPALVAPGVDVLS